METPSFRRTGRPEMRWEDDVKHELKTIKTFQWKKASEMEEWMETDSLRGPKFTEGWSAEEEQVEE